MRKQALLLPELDLFHFIREGLAGKGFSIGGEYAEPGSLGDPCQDGLRLLFQPGGNFGGGGVLRQPALRQLCQGEPAVAAQPFGVFRSGRDIKFFLELAHGDQCDFKHSLPPVFS